MRALMQECGEEQLSQGTATGLRVMRAGLAISHLTRKSSAADPRWTCLASRPLLAGWGAGEPPSWGGEQLPNQQPPLLESCSLARTTATEPR